MTHDPTSPPVDCCLDNMSTPSTRLNDVSTIRRLIDTFLGHVHDVATSGRDRGVATLDAAIAVNLVGLGYGQ